MSFIRNVPGAPKSLDGVISWAQKLTQALTLFASSDFASSAQFSGMQIPWPDTAVKDASWYFLEGQTLKIATDQGLYRVFGTSFNTGGEGADEFTLPSPAAPHTGHKWMVKR